LGRFQQPQPSLSKLEEIDSNLGEIRNISINWKNVGKFNRLKQLWANGSRSTQIWAKWNSFIQLWV